MDVIVMSCRSHIWSDTKLKMVVMWARARWLRKKLIGLARNLTSLKRWTSSSILLRKGYRFCWGIGYVKLKYRRIFFPSWSIYHKEFDDIYNQLHSVYLFNFDGNHKRWHAIEVAIIFDDKRYFDQCCLQF